MYFVLVSKIYMSALIFIDTNIYLDFYRGSDINLSILKHFEANHTRIITTSEVEMEYKSNRQRVILDSLEKLKPINTGSITIPAFLNESKHDKLFTKQQKALTKEISLLKDKTAKLLESPSHNDPVYRVLQRLFKSNAPCHLTRSQKIKRRIRREARQRFALGYPPRKRDEISMIDAINWEWIIYCALNSGDDIIIATRDTDYGCHYQGKSILNDWLLQEFKERVSRKRSIRLTARLTDAFKQLAIPVSKEEEESEESLIKSSTVVDAVIEAAFNDVDTLPSFDPKWPEKYKVEWFKAFERLLINRGQGKNTLSG